MLLKYFNGFTIDIAWNRLDLSVFEDTVVHYTWRFFNYPSVVYL